MQQSLKNLLGFKLQEKNGAIGHVADFYFDDRRWVVRYLVADYGNWVTGHEKVLIAGKYLRHADWTSGTLSIDLTMRQVEDCPSKGTHIPISRQYHQHKIFTPADPVFADSEAELEALDLPNAEDFNLASFIDTKGYQIEAKDGTVGHLVDLMVDEGSWNVVTVVVSTQNWWPGKEVLIAPANVKEISRDERKVHIDLTRQELKDSVG